MRLSIKPIKNYQNNNSFDYASEWNIMQGEANELYMQIVDLDQESLRYMPSVGATLQVTFPALNSANILTIGAILPDPRDPSIYKVSLLSTQIPSTGNVQISLTENLSTKRFVLQQGIVVNSLNQGGC